MARQAAAELRGHRRPLRQPRPRHGRGRLGRAFPRAVGMDQHRRRPRCVARNRPHPRLPPAHGGVLRPPSRPAERPDRRLDPRRCLGGRGDQALGQVEMGGRGAAAAAQRDAGRPPRPRTDLARRRGPRPRDRPSQLHLVGALFSRLHRDVGQRVPGAALLAPVGRDALHGRVPSPAASSTAIRACGSACSNAASAGCRSGSGGWTSR